MDTGVDLYKILDASEGVVKEMMSKPQEIDPVSIVSGLAGVFSGFSSHVRKAAEKFGVDPRDIFMELGRRKVVAGQEDIAVEVAAELAKKIKDKQ
jgi:4-hydroxy 2-oxovalerate aldolase